MIAPAILSRSEFIRRYGEAMEATALRGAPPFGLAHRPCDGGCVATLVFGDGEAYRARFPMHMPASRVVVDQAGAQGGLNTYLDLLVKELRERRDAGEPPTPGDRCMIYFWPAVRGEVEPVSDMLAYWLTSDFPMCKEMPDGTDRLVWEELDRLTPKTPDTEAAAEAAQLLVDVGKDAAVSLAAGVRYAAFEDERRRGLLKDSKVLEAFWALEAAIVSRLRAQRTRMVGDSEFKTRK